MAAPHANRAVDITETFDRKLAGCGDMRARSVKGQTSRNVYELGAAYASSAGLAEGRLAEVFQVVSMPPSGSA